MRATSDLVCAFPLPLGSHISRVGCLTCDLRAPPARTLESAGLERTFALPFPHNLQAHRWWEILTVTGTAGKANELLHRPVRAKAVSLLLGRRPNELGAPESRQPAGSANNISSQRGLESLWGKKGHSEWRLRTHPAPAPTQEPFKSNSSL